MTNSTALVLHYDVPNYKLSAADIKEISKKLVSEKKALYDRIAEMNPEDATFDNVVGALAMYDNQSYVDYSTIAFLQHVSADKDIRDASTEAEQMLEEFYIETRMRKDVYQVVKHLFENTDKWAHITGEDRRLFTKTELEYRRDGLALNNEDGDKLKEILKRISELAIKFSKNINEGDAEILFTKEQLDGLPDDFFEGRPTKIENGIDHFVVTTKYPDLFAVLKSANNELTRKNLVILDERKCKENNDILAEVIKLRLRAAKLLGYKSHAEFVLEEKMAKNIPSVVNFENDLINLLNPLADKEIEMLTALKEKHLGYPKDKEASKIYSWDIQYYFRLLKEQLYDINEQQIKEYFSMEQVTKGILDIFQKMLGLIFTEMPNSNAWHSDVKLYQVNDAKSKVLVGHFWMDLFPRDGKYNHAACWPLRPGFDNLDGTRSYPVCAIVANFTKPTATKPSLLKHDEVVTYFHEFGHVMHGICSLTKWSRFHGTNVESDFVEAPSQMLENWCWEPKVLQSFSKHYVTGEPIPESIVKNLIDAKNVNAGIFNLRQIFFGVFDMTVHSTETEDIDILGIYSSLRKNICKVDLGDINTWPVATFGHILGGYDAGYYGYLWSQVFSADMFENRFKKDGVSNDCTGLEYRYQILQPGGSRDAKDSLYQFLGRNPDNKAFLKSIGMK
ncbi:hypothetical protein BB561_004325 [Smittium simulii]|uniref:Peptidase M3A/M3B catalytic domain-containing protein n=1 Tax=Smittium simulii TaxID=133385 RepID=A0A2T9YGY2_9FUNG|nr:hypothetical protein BB561_004325 [Smittium simulii]